MKKIISVVLSLILAFSAFSVVAGAEEVTDPLVYSVDAEGYATLVSCDPSVEGAITVPSLIEVDGTLYEVKYIGNSAFEGCELITTIELSDGIEQIDDLAFFNCTALTDVYVPESLVFCSYTAFSGTKNVVVHCYSSNYQFFTVFAVIQSLQIDVIDSVGDDLNIDIGIEGVGSLGSVDLMNTIILMIKRIFQMVLYFFINYDTDVEPEEALFEADSSTVYSGSPVAVF